ncbi:unnamed protein product [Larinioides sclopetarius]|uniref:Antistasin-like domain-containing protein n=1 Tax=Larinioides sclopetarius TaxID=280406 RepID=A0AAV2AEK6_9ARAC
MKAVTALLVLGIVLKFSIGILSFPQVQCGIPKCDPGCSLNYNTKPCPSCQCGPGLSVRARLRRNPQIGGCSMPRCKPPCNLDYSTPCPTCQCGRYGSRIPNPTGNHCSTPRYQPPCQIKFGGPCPVCVC